MDRSIKRTLELYGSFLRGGRGIDLKKISRAFRNTDVVRSKNAVESSGTFHFVENCSLYNFTWFKQNFIIGL